MRSLGKPVIGLIVLIGVLVVAPGANAFSTYTDFGPDGSWYLNLVTTGQNYSAQTFAFDKLAFTWLSGDKFETPWINSISNGWTLQSGSTPTYMAIAGAVRPVGGTVSYQMHFGPDSTPPAAFNVRTYLNGQLKEITYTEWTGSHLIDYDLPLASVPEPSLLPVLGLGLAAVGGWIRKRRSTS